MFPGSLCIPIIPNAREREALEAVNLWARSHKREKVVRSRGLVSADGLYQGARVYTAE